MRQRISAGAICAGMLGGLVVPGCMPLPIPGGQLIRDPKFQPPVVVAYEAEGESAPGTSYLLVRDSLGLAVFERAEDGTGTLLQMHWSDAYGDHFAVWGGSGVGQAVEIVIPRDRSEPGYRFVYEPWLYRVEGRPGFEHPVPTMLIEASTKLHPIPSSKATPASPSRTPVGAH